MLSSVNIGRKQLWSLECNYEIVSICMLECNIYLCHDSVSVCIFEMQNKLEEYKQQNEKQIEKKNS